MDNFTRRDPKLLRGLREQLESLKGLVDEINNSIHFTPTGSSEINMTRSVIAVNSMDEAVSRIRQSLVKLL